ncbi:hypothetical protein B0H13DRAFT_1916034 [Mycena leptocephala]|nr:hypothetical protein B0H13DRAFT_1916034 [Mycena leptocephala]
MRDPMLKVRSNGKKGDGREGQKVFRWSYQDPTAGPSPERVTLLARERPPRLPSLLCPIDSFGLCQAVFFSLDGLGLDLHRTSISPATPATTTHLPSPRRSTRDPDGQTDRILLLKTQLALKTELRRQLATELCGRDELIRALQTKLAQRNDFGADMEQIQRIQCQLDQLQRSSRALRGRMQHNIVVDAGSRLRALYSCLANLQRGEGSWKDVEEELRQALKSCGVAVARLEKEKEGLAAAAIYGGVTRDPIYQFDISTTAEFSRDTPKDFDILTKIFVFLRFSGNFEACLTAWRFDRGSGDA